MKKSLLLCVCLFCLSLIFTATAESIYQVALLQSLAQGYFDGSITVADLKVEVYHKGAVDKLTII